MSTFPSSCAERVSYFFFARFLFIGFHASAPLSIYFSTVGLAPSPGLRVDSHCLTTHQLLCCIANQRLHSSWLIAVYGPDRLVSFTLARHLNSIIVATLFECLSIDLVITGGAVASFTLVN